MSQKPGVGLPQLHLLVVWSARGGGVLDHVRGPSRDGELCLLHRLLPTLAPRDIVIYDRAAGHYVGCALLRAHQADLISRVATREIDWRKGVRLGPGDRLVTWKKARKNPGIWPTRSGPRCRRSWSCASSASAWCNRGFAPAPSRS